MSDQDIQAIARTIWGEIRSLGHEGMRAVACVIMNRVAKKKWYGLTPYEVCMKHNSKGIYQFDCNDPDDPNCDKCQNVTTDDPQFVDAIQIAEDAVQFNWMDITHGATSYYSTTISTPWWAEGKTPCFVIGNTNFYNNID